MSRQRFHPSLTPHHGHYRSECDYTTETSCTRAEKGKKTLKVTSDRPHELILREIMSVCACGKLVEENVGRRIDRARSILYNGPMFNVTDARSGFDSINTCTNKDRISGHLNNTGCHCDRWPDEARSVNQYLIYGVVEPVKFVTNKNSNV